MAKKKESPTTASKKNSPLKKGQTILKEDLKMKKLNKKEDE